MAIDITEVRLVLDGGIFDAGQAFDVLAAIGRHGAFRDRNEARELVIRALDHRRLFTAEAHNMLQALVREYGLFPYLRDVVELPLSDRIAYETHRPTELNFRDDLVFHSEQAMVYERLLAGENVVLSAPTSFGKSLIIDAILAAKDFDNAAIIVPTLALMDETRRRLSRLRNRFKIITHGTQQLASRNLWVMTQERLLEVGVPSNLEFFVVDEFYKLDPAHSDERSNQLNILLWQLLATGAQFYLLGPNITSLTAKTADRLRATFISTGFSTVATDIERIRSTKKDLPDDLARTCRDVGPGTIIFCSSPVRTREVANWLIERGVGEGRNLDSAAEWLGSNYHPDWILPKALRRGIGIHHGRLPRALGHHIVRLFDEQRISFLIVTSTLIEGVNTTAKNVIIVDNTISRKKYDYFTYSNIRGRSGRMMKHFVGRVVVFNPEPQSADLNIDVPVLSQSDAATPEVLIQLPEEQLTEASRERLRPYLEQDLVSIQALRDNRGVSLDRQMHAAQTLAEDRIGWMRTLSWRGAFPSTRQVRDLGPILFQLTGSGPAVKSPAQLGARINILRFNRGNVRALVESYMERSSVDADRAVDDTFDFIRNWAQFKIPTALTSLTRIALDVLGSAGLSTSDTSVFAGELENSFLPPFTSVLEEYGLPTPLTVKLELDLGLRVARNLDDVLERLRAIRAPGGLSPFEREMFDDSRAEL